MKKLFLSVTVIVMSLAYAVYQHVGGGTSAPRTISSSPSVPFTQVDNQATNHVSNAPNTINVTDVGEPQKQVLQPPQTNFPETTPTPTPSPQPTPTSQPAPKPQGQYADGTYTGNAANAYYGYIQVQAVIKDGRLSDVVFLRYPNGRRTSIYINQQALPLLRQEAIQVQSANVSGVSGASDSSAAFRQSLGNALAQAKN